MLQEGSKAPNFTLKNHAGDSVSLSDFAGSKTLVYFYPKDDTPGCTKEACTITELYDDFEKAGIVVLGISKDSPESHRAFREKYNLPFALLSDPDGSVIDQYGAKGFLGTKRISYLIDPNGNVLKTYPNVDPATHAYEILKDAKSL
ncbi:MAG: peroxiredoxin [Candidatus Pacebacteria bacterium]|nr:peroxiredoxin [Candidatus Paceibacterota bacterium]